jgi:hypothetical protein
MGNASSEQSAEMIQESDILHCFVEESRVNVVRSRSFERRKGVGGSRNPISGDCSSSQDVPSRSVIRWFRLLRCAGERAVQQDVQRFPRVLSKPAVRLLDN